MVYFRLQIWKHWDDAYYQLVYEYRTSLPATEGLSTWTLPDPPSLPCCMHYGWTMEDVLNPISYDFQLIYPLYYRSVGDMPFPEVGMNYTFQSLAYPAVYSISVRLDTREYANVYF